MFYEQYVTRLVFALPSLVLIALFLPIRGGGYEYLGIIDWDFLSSGALDFVRLLIEVAAVAVIALVLEKVTIPHTNYP